MKRRLLPIAALLCALPASGADLQLSQPVIHALTPMDSLPSTTALNAVLSCGCAPRSRRSVPRGRATTTT
jgi:hypothetical protein